MIGSRLAGRYEILSELGRGGRGVVYRAKDPLLRRQVAIKVVPPALSSSGTSTGDRSSGDTELRFEREATLIAQMDHPSIVPIFDFGRDQGTLFLVMPVLEGETLREHFQRGTLNLSELLEVFAQVADGLDYSHDLGIVHRDIKPENVMVSRERDRFRVRVMDFGLAQDQGEAGLTRSGQLPGTLSYLSPEQVLGLPLDGRCDLYALGAMFYEALAGEPPFVGTIYNVLYRIAQEVPAPLRDIAGSKLEALVLSCLAKDPDARPARASDLAAALRALAKTAAEAANAEAANADRKGLELVVRRSQGQGSSPLIGRVPEMAVVSQRLGLALEGECQLLLVGGEAGVGKSRFLAEIETQARNQGFRVLRGRFAPGEQGLPYHGLYEPIEDFFRVRRSSSSAVLSRPSALAVSEPLLDDLAPRLVALFPPLGEVPELRSAAEGKAKEEGPHKALDLFELLARAYGRMAGEEPLLLSLENLHHDGAAAEALQYIVRRLGSSRTLIAATWRGDQLGKNHPLNLLLRDFAEDPRCLSLQLGPLMGEDYRALLGMWLGGAPLRVDLVDKLQAITEGNPLFTREIVASWRSSGELRADSGGRLTLRDSSAELPVLPATIQQAVTQQLVQLPLPLRQILELAAVLGRSFSEKALADLLADLPAEKAGEGDLGENIEVLIEQGLLLEERATRQDSLRFAHGLLRDALYLELPRRRRRRLHRQHAEWLEKCHGDKLEVVYPQLLIHWAAAEIAEKAVVYALQVGKHALAAFSPQEAIVASRRGLELAEEEGGEPLAKMRAELLFLLARAYLSSGEMAAALLQAEQAAELFSELGEKGKAGEAAALAADMAWQARRAETAERWLLRGLDWMRSQERMARETSKAAFEELLRLAATTAGLRGERERSAALFAELEARQKRGGDGEGMFGGEIVAAMANPVMSLEPGNFETDEASEIGALVYETLTFFGAEGELLPWLAASWRELEEGSAFEIELRPEARFSDGTPVQAADVRASILRGARLSSASLAPGFFRVLRDIEPYLAGESEEVAGIEVVGPQRLIFKLNGPLPLFPVLLADLRTAVALAAPDGTGGQTLLGSGPFRIDHFSRGRVRLERVPSYWRNTPARLDAIEFQTGLAPSEIATGLRRGRIDLGRDLLPADLEALLLEPRFRSGLVEHTRKNVYFALFNSRGPRCREIALRRVLSGAANAFDLVWRTLGRFAQPATSLIPPGLLGHDPERRQRRLDPEDASRVLGEAGIELPFELSLLVHPVLLGKYRPLLEALEQAWGRLGISCRIINRDMTGFIAGYRDAEQIDVMLGRWNTDYDDPDNFTYNLLHSQAGICHAYFDSRRGDDMLERARRLRQSSARAELYRHFEDLLEEEAALLPLFYDVDYRLAGARLRGVELTSTYPYVSYAEIALVGNAPSVLPIFEDRGGELDVPSHLALRELDPLGRNLAGRLDVVSTVFETLLRLDDGGRLMPHLASAVDLSADGLRLRLRLRPGLRFHDGRPVTPRDVQASFERLIRRDDPTLSLLLLPIKGAAEVRANPAARLAGCHLSGSSEVLLELERPFFSFPVVLTHPATAIVPAGLTRFDGRWRDGVVGTGAFRIAGWVHGERLELERNPTYWRKDLPRCERLVFHLGLNPAETYRRFVSGELALAGDLNPEDIETLLSEPPIPCRLFQAPRLSTHFLLFNSSQGFFADLTNRRLAAQALDIEDYQRRSASRLTSPARGLIPPALLGLEQRRLGPREKPQAWQAPPLTIAMHGCYRREHTALWQRIVGDLGGAEHQVIDSDAETFSDRWPDPGPDLVAFRWITDYPDAGSFLHVLRFFAQVGMLAAEFTREIDRLLALAQAERELPARRAHYLEIEALLEQECLVVPLFHEQAYRFAAPDLQGLRLGLGVPEVRYEELRHQRSIPEE